MQDKTNPGTAAGFFALGGGQQPFTFTPLHTYLLNLPGWNNVIALIVSGAFVFLVAIILRNILLFAFRATGQVRYTSFWQGIENMCTFLMFAGGFVAGYFAFGNFFSGLLSGGCWAFIGSGLALQALTANERKH